MLFSCRVMSDSLRPHGLQYARLPCLVIISWSLLKLRSIDSVMPSNHLILCCPLLLLPQSFSGSFPVSWLFASGGKSIGASASASVFPINNEYSELLSFRIDWFDLLVVQGTLKHLLQHHSSKASILQLSFLYSPTLTSIHDYWKNHSFD